jgi:predicted nucleotidyltransferase
MVADVQSRLNVPQAALEDYCRRWRIRRLEVFGSILRDYFGPESDVDFLVTFDPKTCLTLMTLVRAEEELAAIVGRPVDIVERPSIEKNQNWMRRRLILGNARTVYVG